MLDFLVLGPLEARGPDGALDLGGTQQRLLLAVLLMERGRFVGRDTLVDALWPEDPPANARHGVESSVSRLRRALRDGEAEMVIESSPAGYRIIADGHRLDRDAFDQLAAGATEALEAGDPARAAQCADQALKLWRGSALADLSGQPALRAEAAGLDERRQQVLETAAEAQLALGHHADVIPQLQASAAAHPTRERAHELLMLSLYRAGRQAEALETYRSLRAHLADELGLEPGVGARQLHERILRQDAELSLPRRAPPARPPPESGAPPHIPGPQPPAARSHRLRWVLAALALGILVMVAVIAAVSRTSRTQGTAPSEIAKILEAPALGVVNTSTARLEQAFRLGLEPSRLTVGLGAVWATGFDDGKLLRLDVDRGNVTQTIPVGHGPTGVAVAGGDIWVADTLDNAVARVDAASARVVQSIPVGDQPSDVSSGAGAVWVTNSGSGTVSRLHPKTGSVTATIRVGPRPEGIAVGHGAVWVTLRGASAVARIDPRSGRLTRSVHVGSGPSAVAIDAHGVWVANQLDATVSLIDPARDAVVLTRSVTGTPAALATDGTHAWVGSGDQRSLTELDAKGSISTSRLSSPVTALAALRPDRLLLGVRGAGTPHRGGTLRVESFLRLPRFDGRHCCDQAPNLQALMYDDLLGFSTVPGSLGRLVPDLAVAVPTPEQGGRVYRFRLRSGLRYWTGAPVRASDVRRGLEVAARTNIVLAIGLGALPGALQCALGGRAPCDLRQAVRTDDRAGTVTLHLSRPDPNILLALGVRFYAPAPPGRGPIPGTGPYRVARFVPGKLIALERNRFFRPRAPAAQPAGYPDRILWRMRGRPAEGVAAVLAGRADFTADPPTPRQRRQILLTDPSRLHETPLADTGFLFMNTNVPPFNDLRVRRAVNFALDRRAIARAIGGRAAPICQIVPPTIPGHETYCPYTRHPGPHRPWTAPDLPRARRLIAASGTRGMAVTLRVGSEEAPTGRYVLGLLRRLGYRARIRLLPEQAQIAEINDARTRAQIGTGDWRPPAPSPSLWITLLLSCAAFDPHSVVGTSNSAQFCDRTVDSWAGRASQLQGTNPTAAARLWARTDRRITDLAPWAPTVQAYSSDLLSERVGGYQYVPTIGALVDRLWVR